jgi:signal transduction histidine kinase
MVGMWSRFREWGEVGESALPSATRLGALLACLLLALVDGYLPELVPQFVGLLVVALVASLPLPTQRLRIVFAVGEAALVGVVLATAPEGTLESLLPYLLAPGFAAGWAGGLRTAVFAAGALCGVLLTSIPVGSAELSLAAVWCLLFLLVGVLAAGTRSMRRPAADADQEALAYAQAIELLGQLRPIARRLPEGLDTAGVAESLLQQGRAALDATRGAVLAGGAEGEFDIVAEHAMPAGWVSVPRQSGLLEELAAAQHPVVIPGGLLGEGQRRRIGFPLRAGDRRVGLMLLEVDGVPDPQQIAAVQARAATATIRMEAARMFDEVRSYATAEERRRIAREIHDGIAQELASLGYQVDDIASVAVGTPRRQLLELRRRITALVGELRMNIFVLRSDVAPGISLGTALSDYVRQVASASGLTVHVTLTEEPVRLPREVEAELLRIAQEAVTNARRHARARNLWVDCVINPPAARLSVADDGRGLGDKRPDSFGLDVMRERAERIGGGLAVGPRDGGGTVVTATVNADRLVRGSA